jgi:hypothetical protein
VLNWQKLEKNWTLLKDFWALEVLLTFSSVCPPTKYMSSYLEL